MPKIVDNRFIYDILLNMNMSFITTWILSGILGYVFILFGWKKLIGYVTVGRCIQQLMLILTGYFGLAFGLFCFLDAHFDLLGFGDKSTSPTWKDKKLF